MLKFSAITHDIMKIHHGICLRAGVQKHTALPVCRPMHTLVGKESLQANKLFGTRCKRYEHEANPKHKYYSAIKEDDIKKIMTYLKPNECQSKLVQYVHVCAVHV